ncbi:MAG: ATP-binding protein [Acidimicrobiia bacterium]|nr:ATP-binding protein [Acidimicrobiia bacterium]
MEYIPRLVDAQLARALATHPVVLVTGARGVGKTTTAQQVARSAAFFDDTATLTVFQDNPEAALGQFQEPLLVDEWQLAPEVVRAIKRTVDRDRRPGRFILTGSPDPQSRSEFQALTGRAAVVRLNPMTVRERKLRVAPPSEASTVADLLSGTPPAGRPDHTPDIFEYLDLAAVGGFPEAAAGDSEAHAQAWCRDYLRVLLRRDLPLFGSRRSVSHFSRYLTASAHHATRSPEDGSLRNAAQVNPVTHREYRHILLDLDLTVELPAFASDAIRYLAKSPKLLFSDSGLLIAALNVPLPRLKLNGELYGRVIETFALSQILAELEALDMKDALSHLRTHKGTHEIDAVIETDDGGVVAVEVKSANRHRPADIKHLEWLAQQLGDRFKLGLVLTTGRYVSNVRSEVSDRIWAAPISVLWQRQPTDKAPSPE